MGETGGLMAAGGIRRWSIWIAWLALGFAALRALYFWARTMSQPLIGGYAFRESQTAISALFLKFDLHSILNYQTPVLGQPWSIPFEFPLFQVVVAAISRGLGLDLTWTGRMVSLAFGLACLWPALGLLRHYRMGRFAQIVFAALYLGSSIYLYWNRGFMIESMALFFSLVFLWSYLNLRTPAATITARSHAFLLGLTAISLVLALLVKATTALGPFLLVGADVLFRAFVVQGHRAAWLRRVALPMLLILLLGFLGLKLWTNHADGLKALNLTAVRLTSKALHVWNYGTLEQRFSIDLWLRVLVKRMLTPYASVPVACLVLLGLWKCRADAFRREFMIACLVLSLLPLLLFTNLHIVHTYYQVANQVYLLLAVAGAAAIVLDMGRPLRWQVTFAAASLILFFVAGCIQFDRHYRPQAYETTTEKYEIGKMIQKASSPESAMIVMGDDWDSSIPYFSQRRALMLIQWYRPGLRTREQILKDPLPEISPYPLGAVVSNREIDAAELANVCRQPTRLQARADGVWRAYICRLS